MATDFSKPIVTDAYATLLPYVVAAHLDLARQLEPTLTGTSTNVPTGAVRWNATTIRWERYNGTSWVTLPTAGDNVYGISISGNAATATASSSCSGNAATATTATNISGGYITTATNTAAVGSAGSTNTQFMGNASYAAAVSFHRAGSYGINLGLDSDNVFRLGGWSQSGYRWTSDTSGNFVALGNVTAYSDERVKTNWKSFCQDFVSRLAQVKSGTYDRIDLDLTQIGVSAQSLQTLMPHAVLKDTEGKLSVAYGSAALAACIELAKKIILLEARIAALEGK